MNVCLVPFCHCNLHIFYLQNFSFLHFHSDRYANAFLNELDNDGMSTLVDNAMTVVID